ncbi:MAG: hypothetical protein DMG50_26850 [Acidobacteria bacterium]|nr:MAG: hypothetical protein DMG50_26850 [Acidobacteriota bacterium]
MSWQEGVARTSSSGILSLLQPPSYRWPELRGCANLGWMPHLSRGEGWGVFLLGSVCDAKIHHMKKASVRDLRYRFSAVEDLLRDGEEIQITKRKRVIARLLPPDPVAPAAFPDFLARQKKAFGKKRLKVSGAEQLAAERERF